MPRSIVLVGDSLTWGWAPQTGGLPYERSPLAPDVSLTALLAVPGSPWTNAAVYNAGAPAANTDDWARAVHPLWCLIFPSVPIYAAACAAGTGLVQQVTAVVGAVPDAALVTLGTTDCGAFQVPLDQTIVNLRTIEASLHVQGVTHVLLAPPPPDSSPCARAIRDRMLAEGLVTGPDWLGPLPTWDGTHFTSGGHAAFAALWLDTLLALP